jgi:uncharacterized protein DUF6335
MAKRKARARARKAARGAARPRRAASKKKSTKRATKPVRRASSKTKPAAVRRRARPKPAALQRERRRLSEGEIVPSPPSTLNFNGKASAAASGRAALAQHRRNYPESGPALTGGDIDADWGEAYAEGDEAPGGDNPTPDQDVVEEIGLALGIEYEDAEELKGSDKITERDRHRWEYDPASADDYRDRNKKQ